MNTIVFWNGMWPNWFSRSTGVYQLSHWLRINGVDCQVIDFIQWMSEKELYNYTKKFITSKTRFLGISTTFFSNEKELPETVYNVLKLIKNEYPSLKILCGGPRVDELNSPLVDYCISGEAEDKLLQLVKGHNLNKKFDITKLDHKFAVNDCIIEGEVLPIELGRGCIFSCKFCGHHNIGKPKNTYQRCIHLIQDELEYNWENFKVDTYHFVDDTVNEDFEKIKNLSKLPKDTGIDLKWNGYLRADLIWSKPESAELLALSGLKSCFFGIESLHPQASQSIGKGWSGKHAKKFLPHLFGSLWGKNINIWSNFIVGLPYEDVQSLYHTYEWCKENNFGTNRFAPLALYENRKSVKSFLGQNFEKYGYTFNEKNIWSNGFIDYTIAVKLCEEFNSSINNFPSSWILFDLVNCGVKLHEATKISNYNKINYINAFKSNFFKKYLDKLNSI